MSRIREGRSNTTHLHLPVGLEGMIHHYNIRGHSIFPRGIDASGMVHCVLNALWKSTANKWHMESFWSKDSLVYLGEKFDKVLMFTPRPSNWSSRSVVSSLSHWRMKKSIILLNNGVQLTFLGHSGLQGNHLLVFWSKPSSMCPVRRALTPWATRVGHFFDIILKIIIMKN